MARRLRSPRRKEVRARRRKFMFVAVAILALVVLSGFLYLSWQPFVRINSISVIGTAAVSSEEVRAKVEKELSGSYWGILPKNNFLFYPKEEIKNALFSLSGKVKEIAVERNNFTSLTVTVGEFRPYALWCNQAKLCFFLNDEGLIYDPAPSFTGNVYRIYTGGKVSANPQGVYLLPSESFKKLEKIFLQFNTITDSEVLEVHLKEFSEVEGVLTNGTAIFFKLSDNERDILDHLQTTLSAEAFPGINQVEYVDLRFGNKVYFKEKEQEG